MLHQYAMHLLLCNAMVGCWHWHWQYNQKCTACHLEQVRRQRARALS